MTAHWFAMDAWAVAAGDLAGCHLVRGSLEDVGIPPHEVVPVTIEDVRAGRDPILARALAWAREAISSGRLR